MGLGFATYIRDKWNMFDALIAVSSIIDNVLLITKAIEGNDVAQAVFTFLRLLRLFRMLKLARYFPSMREMLRKTVKSLAEIGPFFLLLLLFIFLFSLVGRELFAYKAIVGEDDELIYGEQAIQEYLTSGKLVRYPRINFNTIDRAVITVFILINGEDWVWVAQDWIRAYGNYSVESEAVAAIYFVLVMLVGYMTLFSLFTGILLHSFQ